jgi:hypothetical protein
VSYSREDRAFVAPLVALFRISGVRVFRDEDDIKPGDRWTFAIDDAIDNCDLLLLFWCCHSASSDAV